MLIGISGRIGSGKDTIGNIIQYLTSKRSAGYTYPDTALDFNSYLENKHHLKSSWQIKKFTYKLKQIISILTGISIEDLEKQEVKDRILGEEWQNAFRDYSGDMMNAAEYADLQHKKDRPLLTVRSLLQLVGTDAMRDVIHPYIWINALFADYKPFIENYPQLTKSNGKELIEGNSYSMGKAILPNWIITDVRFSNELRSIRDREGIVIRVNRKSWYDVTEDNARREFEGKPSVVEHPSETALDYAKFDYYIDNSGTIDELIIKVKEILIKEHII